MLELSILFLLIISLGVNVFFLFIRSKHILDRFTSLSAEINHITKMREDFDYMKQDMYKIKGYFSKFFVTSAPPPPSPNDAIKKDDESMEFLENNFISIPNDVKFEVEGGDMNVPTGYVER